ncbi:hypothetical protein [Brevundimonas sp.]|uniref:hypothetical protein n=1 Tax=Brevundimonas sp. TaxID=1871086 RepID=UPI0025D7E7E1|nr:hypothetical protein [Brevundimonas sp.]
MSIALAGLLDTKSPAALGVFAALRGFRSQRDVLEGAAKAVLNADEVDLIAACLSAIWTAQRARDDIAHGLWGVLLEEPDLLLWIANADYAVWNAAAIAAGGGGDEHAELAKKLFVYTKRDLLMARDALMAARNVSFEMSMYCQWRPGRPQTREAIRDQLLKRPLVRQALDHLIAARSR